VSLAGVVLPLEAVTRQIRRQRILLGLTQTELAKAAGTSQSLVAKLERGRLSPSYEVVRRLVEALDARAATEEPDARSLMQSRPIWVEPAERLGKALERMKSHGFSQLPVVDLGSPVGSLSERAVLGRIEAGAELEALKRQPVKSVMGPSFPTVDPRTRRRTLVEILRDNDAVLVMDAGKVLGVITKSDLW
jgi:predicted transcriptional regulator